MSDNELLLAISDILDKNIKKIESNLNTRPQKMRKKYDCTDPYDCIESMEEIFASNGEGEIYQKYKDQIDRTGTFESNLEVIKCVVREHCERLSAMKI